jgi:hypothetical protein
MGPNTTHAANPNLVAGSQPAGEDQRVTTPAAPGADGPQKVTFGKDAAGFLTELLRRVDDYFVRTGKGKNDSWQMYLKSAVILTALASSYVLLVFVAETRWQAVPLALMLGVSMALAGFNIQHDGGHHSYSRRTWVNKLAAMTLDLIGASSYLWSSPRKVDTGLRVIDRIRIRPGTDTPRPSGGVAGCRRPRCTRRCWPGPPLGCGSPRGESVPS